jgi:hypothetical protein
LACRSKITSVCARQPARRSRRCSRPPTHLSARPGTSPPTHAARRVLAGYPGLVGSVPPTISALTALTRLCAPFARPGSPPMRRMRCFASAWAVLFRRGRMLRFARSGPWARTASPARSSRASRRSPGLSFCTPRRRPCGLPADSGVLNGHAAAQGPRREPLLRQSAADDLRAERAHVAVRPFCAAGLAADAAHASQRERRGCAFAVWPVRPHALLCAIRDLGKNGFTGPIPASITALTRLVALCAPSPPVRSPSRLAHAERARCGAGPSARTASPAACRRRSPR